MPLDDSIGILALRGILAVIRFAAEALFDYFFAWVGKGVIFTVTFGRFNPDLDETGEYILACSVGVLATALFVCGVVYFIPSLR